MRNSLIGQRVKNILGDSDLDDQLTKDILQMITDDLQQILTEQEPRMIFYRQGSVAALRAILEKARLINKHRIAQEELDEEEN